MFVQVGTVNVKIGRSSYVGMYVARVKPHVR